MTKAWPLMKYFWNRSYSEIKSIESVEFADKLRLPLLVSFVSVIVSAVFLIAGLIWSY